MFRSSEPAPRRCPLRAMLTLGAMSAFAFAAFAQEDLSLPPRVDESTADIPAQASTDESQAPIEEIVVISDQNPWRLPDLGSAWRAAQEAEPDTGRISADLLPLWDPEAEQQPTRNPFAVTDGIRRVGFIEIFRVRFGDR